MSTKNRINQTEIIRENRNQAQKIIIENLQKVNIGYDKR